MLSRAIYRLIKTRNKLDNHDSVLLKPSNFDRFKRFAWCYVSSIQIRYNKVYYRGLVFEKKI